MENGNIREYALRNPGVDRVRLLSEIASGACETWYGVNGLY